MLPAYGVAYAPNLPTLLISHYLPTSPSSRSVLSTDSAIPALLIILILMATACSHGLAPPDEPRTGIIAGEISYVNHPDAWPPPDEVHELLFVAMRFIPQDTADFLQLNRIVFSEPLERNVAGQRIVVEAVPTGPYLYSGVAQKYGPGTFQWRPIGLVEEDGGAFVVVSDETTRVTVTADFVDRPPFPPPPLN